MTRRDRHIRTLRSFPSDTARFTQATIIARLGLDAFTDEAIEAMAREALTNYRRQQRYNREHRGSRTAGQALSPL